VAGGGSAVLAGSVDFIDATQTTGAIGLGGGASLAPSVAAGDSPLPTSGTVSNFAVHALPNAASGTISFTVYVNGVASAVACTLTAPSTSCATDQTVTATAGQPIAVVVANATGDFVRYARWTASYG
jgi:hypothetical protein